MLRLLFAAIVVCFLMLGVLVYLLFNPDAPGGWYPSPPGSGWCVAHGIPGVPDGYRAQCPRP